MKRLLILIVFSIIALMGNAQIIITTDSTMTVDNVTYIRYSKLCRDMIYGDSTHVEHLEKDLYGFSILDYVMDGDNNIHLIEQQHISKDKKKYIFDYMLIKIYKPDNKSLNLIKEIKLDEEL